LTFRARFDLRLEIQRVDGALVLTRIPIAVDETPLRIQGRVGASLYRSARAAGRESLGLGLYITSMLVTAHGGRLWVDSRPGEGSTFRRESVVPALPKEVKR